MSDQENEPVQNHAEAIAARVPHSVGIDPATVINILQVILPILARCFAKDDQPDPGQVRASLIEQDKRQPQRLRRRMTARIMRDSPERRITRDQALAMAEATIREAHESDDATVAAFCAANLE